LICGILTGMATSTFMSLLLVCGKYLYH
jgi:hypothetical protein